jgi:1-acyl-sn-glycerol-3-phosphate acyltransferase
MVIILSADICLSFLGGFSSFDIWYFGSMMADWKVIPLSPCHLRLLENLDKSIARYFDTKDCR